MTDINTEARELLAKGYEDCTPTGLTFDHEWAKGDEWAALNAGPLAALTSALTVRDEARAERDELLPYKEELVRIADELGDASDPFAAWESIAALQSERDSLRAALEKAVAYDDLLLKFKGPAVLFAGDVEAIDAAYDEWVSAARAALRQS